METSAERESLKTLHTLVGHYDQPPHSALVLEQLLTLTQCIEITTDAGNQLQNLRDTPRIVAELADELRPALSALIGPTIGHLYSRAVTAIDEEIETYQSRVDLIQQIQDGNENSPSLFDKLVESGWRTHLSKDEWLASDYEMGLSKMAEEHVIGRLNYERTKANALHKRFVQKDGELGTDN